MAGGQIAPVGCQKIEGVFNFLGDFLAGKDMQPGCCQFDAEGHTVHQITNLANSNTIFAEQRKIGAHAARTLEKQLNCAITVKIFRIGIRRVGQTLNVVNPFFLQIEAFAGCCQNFHAGGSSQDIAEQAGAV